MREISNFDHYFELNNGIKIPRLGFGTWQMKQGIECEKAVKTAIQSGYRHIDTASAYGNEESIGAAIKGSDIQREEIFLTSKVFNCDRGYETTLHAFEHTLKRLGTGYLDLYLIHWPATEKSNPSAWQKENLKTWRALEELYKTKKVRAIGVSNFLPQHLDPLLKDAEYQPMVNQIEFHPGYMQSETVKLCKDLNMLVEAWSPLGSGKVLHNKELAKVALKYQKSTAQLCVRWCLQQGVLPLLKTVHKERMEENANVFDFVILQEDMDRIAALTGIDNSGLHPDRIDF